jgi:hypothetical protein
LIYGWFDDNSKILESDLRSIQIASGLRAGRSRRGHNEENELSDDHR